LDYNIEALGCFRKMKVKQYRVESSDFDLFYDKYTNGKRNDYVLIGIDSPFGSTLNIRYHNYERFYEQTVPFVDIDSTGRYQLADLDDYVYFKGLFAYCWCKRPSCNCWYWYR